MENAALVFVLVGAIPFHKEKMRDSEKESIPQVQSEQATLFMKTTFKKPSYPL